MELPEPMAFVVAVLATWRITHLLQAEDGPWELMVRLRRLLGSGVAGELFHCFYCLSVWISLPFACWLGSRWLEVLIFWPALSGGAILLHRATDRAEASQWPLYVEDPPEESP